MKALSGARGPTCVVSYVNGTQSCQRPFPPGHLPSFYPCSLQAPRQAPPPGQALGVGQEYQALPSSSLGSYFPHSSSLSCWMGRP